MTGGRISSVTGFPCLWAFIHCVCLAWSSWLKPLLSKKSGQSVIKRLEPATPITWDGSLSHNIPDSIAMLPIFSTAFSFFLAFVFFVFVFVAFVLVFFVMLFSP